MVYINGRVCVARLLRTVENFRLIIILWRAKKETTRSYRRHTFTVHHVIIILCVRSNNNFQSLRSPSDEKKKKQNMFILICFIAYKSHEQKRTYNTETMNRKTKSTLNNFVRNQTRVRHNNNNIKNNRLSLARVRTRCIYTVYARVSPVG